MRKHTLIFGLVVLCSCTSMNPEEQGQYLEQNNIDTVYVRMTEFGETMSGVDGIVAATHVRLRSQPDLSSSTIDYLTYGDQVLIIDSVLVQSCDWAVTSRTTIAKKYSGEEMIDANQAVKVLSASGKYVQVEIDSSGYRIKAEIIAKDLEVKAFHNWYKVRSSKHVGWVFNKLVRPVNGED